MLLMSACKEWGIQGGKIRSEDNQNLKNGCPRHYFGRPHFVTFLHVCSTSSHTAVFICKRKIFGSITSQKIW